MKPILNDAGIEVLADAGTWGGQVAKSAIAEDVALHPAPCDEDVVLSTYNFTGKPHDTYVREYQSNENPFAAVTGLQCGEELTQVRIRWHFQSDGSSWPKICWHSNES